MTNQPIREALARAIESTPQLWLYEVEEDEWQICHWGKPVGDDKREWVVVGEACNENEARQKQRRLVRDMRADAALAALEAAGVVMVPELPTPKMVNATWEHTIDRAGGIESQNTRNARVYAAMLAARPK